MSIFGVDIRTIQIIEKGSWDEVFSINGGGHVHLKLHFSLTEEDRNRIRVMVMFSSTFFLPLMFERGIWTIAENSLSIYILLVKNKGMTPLKYSNSI